VDVEVRVDDIEGDWVDCVVEIIGNPSACPVVVNLDEDTD
jgi:hypothetical protein